MPRPPTLVGVAVAVGGNICISLALNVQKLAHKRLERRASGASRSRRTQRSTSGQRSRSRSRSLHHSNETTSLLDTRAPKHQNADPARLSASSPPSPPATKVAALALFSQTDPSARQLPPRPLTQSKSTGTVPLMNSYAETRGAVQGYRIVEAESMHGTQGRGLPETPSAHRKSNPDPQPSNPRKEPYIKSPLWLGGIALMIVGEFGNFLAYGFAPASVVAPLGTVALVANCAIAPLLLGEVFDTGDLLGIGLAIIGAVQVVMSGNGSDGGDRPLGPDTLLELLGRAPFIVYTCINIGVIALLTALARTQYGRRVVYVDVGLCGFIGSWTVLSTKAFSSFISLMFLECFRYPITWLAVAILVSTAVLQVALLQRCLQRYEAKIVVPLQFVIFTIVSIVGSAVLFGDFQSTNASRLLTFVFGVCSVFAGVYLLTRHENGSKSDAAEAQDGEPQSEEQRPHTAEPHPPSSSPRSVAVPTPPSLQHRRSQPLPVASPGYFLIASPQQRRRGGPLRDDAFSSDDANDSEDDRAEPQPV